jgi:hypothetical protein
MNPLGREPLTGSLMISRRAPTGATARRSANCGGEPVAATNLCANQIPVFAQGIAQREDLNLQILFRDNDARPNTPEELVFADQRSIGLQQSEKEIEGAGAQLYRGTVGNQLALASQYTKPSEL